MRDDYLLGGLGWIGFVREESKRPLSTNPSADPRPLALLAAGRLPPTLCAPRKVERLRLLRAAFPKRFS